MLHPFSRTLGLAALALGLTACDSAANLAAATLGGALPGEAGSLLPVTIEGRAFATADQVAIVAGGAGNIVAGGAGNIVAGGAGNISSPGGLQPRFGLLARSDEQGVAKAKVVLEDLAGKQPKLSGETDGSGRFTLEGKGNTNYRITVTLKSGQLTGLALARALQLKVELDLAHHMAAAAVLAGDTKAKLDAAKFEELILACRAVTSTVAKAPTLNSEAEAKAFWDQKATAELKAKLEAVKAK